ncbi:MAG: FHA domain-containing protein [Myxococcota bacterium]
MSGFRVVRPLTIEVTEGPDQPSQLGPLSFPIRIGAAEGNEVVLNDPTVSSYHCTLEEGPEGIIIRDTGSTNGVWIGGHRVLVGVISETTQITLGRTTLDLQLGDSRPEPEQTITDDKFGRLIGRSPMMLQGL